MINRQEILTIAEIVEKSETFSMDVVHNCGAPACVLGHILARHDPSFLNNGDDGGGVSDSGWLVAERALGIGMSQLEEVFAPRYQTAHYLDGPGSPGHITQEHAAAFLRKLATTNCMDWEGTRPNG